MTALTTYNTFPYYDDFDDTKNYLRILFRPRYPIQARELTQAQTILQNQIGAMADHFFKNGSMIIPGNVSINEKIGFIKIETSFTHSGNDYTAINRTDNYNGYYLDFIGRTITTTDGVVAEVIDALPPVDNDSYALFVRYTNPSNTYEPTFTAEDILSTNDDGGLLLPLKAKVKSLDHNPIGYGISCGINAGIYYINKAFVYVPQQTKIISRFSSPYNEAPLDSNTSVKAILRAVENTVSEGDDSSLLDPSLGTPNSNAPGATRYKISLVLDSDTVENPTYKSNIIELVKFKDGVKTFHLVETTYSEIMKMISQRTYEESGDYFLNPFMIQAREHKTDSTKLSIGLDPSTAYVKGYRINKIATEWIDLDKARTSTFYNASVTQITNGNYIFVNYIGSLPYFNNFEQLAVYSWQPNFDTVTSTNSSTSVTVADGTKYKLGDNIRGNFIPTASYVSAINGNTLTLTLAATGTGSSSVTLNRINGVMRFNALEYHSGTIGTDACVYKAYISDIQLREGESLNTSTGVWGLLSSGEEFYCDFVQPAIIYGSSNSSIYSLPYNTVKTLYPVDNNFDTMYECYILETNLSPTSRVITLTAGTYDVFIETSNWLISFDFDNSGGLTYKHVIPTSIVLSGNSKTATITLPVSTENSDKFSILYRVRRNPGSVSTMSRAKTASNGTTHITPNLYSSSAISFYLNKADVYEINAIYMSADFNTAATNADTNVTNNYTLLTGQTDKYYNFSSIQLKPGVTAPTGRLLVDFNYFAPSANGDVFTVDSYAGIDYKDIPVYKGQRLSDVIDARLIKVWDNNSLNPSGTFVKTSVTIPPNSFYAIVASTTDNLEVGLEVINPNFPPGTALCDWSDPGGKIMVFNKKSTNTTQVTSQTLHFVKHACSNAKNQLIQNSLFTADMSYYLPRIDVLYLDCTGNFGISYGIPSLSPKLPLVPQTAMGLYRIGVEAYTFDTKGLNIQFIENRRYTMRDINRLDNRIGNLEYYTSLSMIERSVADVQLYDSNGDQRYKTGFIADGFYSYRTANLNNNEFRSTIDTKVGILGPLINTKQVELNIDKINSSDIILHNNDIVTLDYDEVKYFEQPYASYAEYVNPYNIFVWAGGIELKPDQDEWIETEVLPTIMVRQDNGIDEFINNNSGSVENLLRNYEIEGTDKATILASLQRDIARGAITQLQADAIYKSYLANSGNTGRYRSIIVNLNSITTYTAEENSSSLGERVIDVSIVPFIRCRQILFKAERLKPNTKFYPVFNGDDVSGMCKQITSNDFMLYDSNGVRNNLVYDYNIGLSYGNNHPNTASTLISNSSGVIYGSLFIPVKRFPTGIRTFRLSDHATHSTSSESSFAEGIFQSRGLLQKKQNVILTTRTLKSDTVLNANISFRARPVDPLAQSFFVPEPTGIMVTSIEVFFEKIDPNIPIYLSLQTMENGTPTTNTIPTGECTLYASDILAQYNAKKPSGAPTITTVVQFNELSNVIKAATPIKFSFVSPVFLMPYTEYAFRLVSNSDNYKTYVAELGKLDILTNTTISSQITLGSFFKSQNTSTWTAEQFKDMKYKMNRAEFVTSGQLKLNNADLNTVLLEPNAIESVSGTGAFRIHHKNHGFCGDDFVTLSGVTGSIGGASDTFFNGTHPIRSAIEQDSYWIVKSGHTSPSSGRGGGSAIKATHQAVINKMLFNAPQLTFEGTSITNTASLLTGRSIGGIEVPYRLESGIPLLTNTEIGTLYPYVVATHHNTWVLSETPATTTKSLKITMALTGSKYVSPLVDTQNISLATACNRIDNPTQMTNVFYSLVDGKNQVYNYKAETDPKDGTVLAKYVSKEILLNEPAAALNAWANVNRPTFADIEFYYKIRETGSDISFNEIPWVGPVEPNEMIEINTNPMRFFEAAYEITEDDLNDTLFSSFMYKIVMKSSNSSQIPTLKDFRIVAVV